MMFGLVPLSDAVSAALNEDRQPNSTTTSNVERVNAIKFERIKANSVAIEGIGGADMWDGRR